MNLERRSGKTLRRQFLAAIVLDLTAHFSGV
jgi:hypothetical protein